MNRAMTPRLNSRTGIKSEFGYSVAYMKGDQRGHEPKGDEKAGTILIRGELIGPATDKRIEAIRSRAPEHRVVVAAHDARELEVDVEQIEIVFGNLPRELWSSATGLRWLQLQGAGADNLPDEARERDLSVTNASGVHAEPISDHLLALIYAFARDLPLAIRQQQQHTWNYDRRPEVFEPSGKRVLLLGTGAIGHAFARKAAALGMKVVGIRRNPEAPLREEGGDTTCYLRLAGPDALRKELPHADVLVITLPLTAETRGMIGSEELGRLPSHALVLNIGRGAIVDQDALIEALRQGSIGGAGLDVFDPEPLPADSPLWDLENVIVTTHYSGITPRYSERLWEIFLDNLGRYVSGEPLRNVVDTKLGY